ncbi:predicted protein [Lichtheimia corymbifera JMRC:FSU:9682]|uniref:Uncharacterized protein n=1 Tax=Lichtheimia corymbifera JMRC:FSU:9682 TaxID=1263082 RepID=A0A068RMM9_9FUNG|nr:predicted protein [Lichtheimia corymbifera JMRC:FSU:9682]
MSTSFWTHKSHGYDTEDEPIQCRTFYCRYANANHDEEQRATELGMESTLKRWLSSLEWITTAKVIGPITGETALSCFEHSLLV